MFSVLQTRLGITSQFLPKYRTILSHRYLRIQVDIDHRFLSIETILENLSQFQLNIQQYYNTDI